ncbi:hypothetical protein SAMN04487944_111106 [Gracilibacillus ureilyticus]|uniref:Uncharacterized protein n=2 Tax=Gracilibacillus ureilyticus TaxID=531814 RepID=A0A1H9SNA8_9BACI|nr:hypothetical protein SAMN04487944_111106 [Gracilibacillus ureilyticus]
MNVKVYTLLMNVDFLPFFEGRVFPPILEWIFHLLIAWIIAFFYLVLLKPKYKIRKSLLACLLSFIAAMSYFPLTVLAKKETPAVDNATAVIFWFSGHAIYGLVLYRFGKRNIHHH